MKYNRLAISISKTSFNFFHCSRSVKPKQLFNIENYSISITEVDSVKYLGAAFDTNLNGINHINDQSPKLSKIVLSKARHFVNNDIVAVFYCSLIYPFPIHSFHV